MNKLRASRALLALTAAACLLYGTWRLLRVGLGNLWATAQWLAGGVVLHDAVLAPLVLLAGVVVTRLVPRWARAAVVTGAIVLGSVTLLAIPVLGRFGARADNPSLLDRAYGLGWLVLAGLVCLGAGLGALVSRRREARPGG